MTQEPAFGGWYPPEKAPFAEVAQRSPKLSG
jgi:hypothetical protein